MKTLNIFLTIKTWYKLFQDQSWNCLPKKIKLKRLKHKLLEQQRTKSSAIYKFSSSKVHNGKISVEEKRIQKWDSHIFQKMKVRRNFFWRWTRQQNLMNLIMWKLVIASNIFWKNVDSIFGKKYTQGCWLSDKNNLQSTYCIQLR